VTKQIVLSYTKDGYSFQIDGTDISFPVKRASMEMTAGKYPSIVVEFDAANVRMEHGTLGFPVCSEGVECLLPVGHEGEHEFVPVVVDRSEVG